MSSSILQSADSPARVTARPGRRGPGVVIGVVLSLALVAAGVFWVVAIAVHQDQRSTSTIDEPFDRLVVESDDGNVVVRQSTSAQATMEQRLRWSFAEPTVTAEVVDGALRVAGDCGSQGPVPQPDCSVDLVLYVPVGTAVDVDSGSGDVIVEGVQGDLLTRTGSGDIRADGVSGSVDARTGSGDIEIDELTASSLTASTGSGDVRVIFSADPDAVEVRAGSGDIDLLLARGDATYAVDAHTGSGNREVDIRTDPSGTRTITARTGSGDLTITQR